MSYFFSQPDADGEPTIWIETGEAAFPMLRRLELDEGQAEDDEDRRRLWRIIERAIGTTTQGMTATELVATPTDAQRERALAQAEEYVAKVSAPPLKPNGYPLDGWRPASHFERLELVLRTARFLLGENE